MACRSVWGRERAGSIPARQIALRSVIATSERNKIIMWEIEVIATAFCIVMGMCFATIGLVTLSIKLGNIGTRKE